MSKAKAGIAQLFGDLSASTAGVLSVSTTLPLSHIHPDPEQPRKHWLEEPLDDLAASIKAQGILQPILVRPSGRDRYVLIAGERRWRAARIAGLQEIPAIVKEVDEPTTRVLSLVENLQREDLTDDEKAHALAEIKKMRRATWEEVGAWVGLSAPRVKALAQVIKEPEEVQALIANGALSEKHLSLTRALKDERRTQLLKEAARHELSAQDTRSAVDLLRADGELSVAAALRAVRGDAPARASSRAARLYATVRLLERFPEDEEADDEFLEALAALEKQARSLRRRLAASR